MTAARIGVASILVDFDGTVCASDVGNALCTRFADGDWPQYDALVAGGRMTLRGALAVQAGMLRASKEEMLAFVLDRFEVDPTFASMVLWAHARGIGVTVVSDGFGFYIEQMLAAAGLADLPTYHNDLARDLLGGWRLDHRHGHPDCAGCGTCKKLVVQQHRELGGVAFVGEGESDRYGALYADVVFAKLRLAEICERDRIAHLDWSDFHNVRDTLARRVTAEARRGPECCPGWTPRRAGQRAAGQLEAL